MRRCLLVLTSIHLVLLSSGCAINFRIKPPVPSSIRYVVEAPESARTIAVVDQRSGNPEDMTEGRGKINLVGLQERPMEFLAEHISAELSARGVKMVPGTEPADERLRVQLFQFRHQQASGFTPFHTMTKFVGHLDHGDTEHRITAYFKNGKVLVWSAYEAEEPNYNIAASLIVKEIATKINRIAYGVQASDDEVQRILTSIEADTSHLVYLRVFELGYSNNPVALPHLKKIAKEHKVRLARAAALSSIGMFEATEEFDFLVEAYETTTNIERAMALKSIGDLDTRDARIFFRKAAAHENSDSMIRDVIELYQ